MSSMRSPTSHWSFAPSSSRGIKTFLLIVVSIVLLTLDRQAHHLDQFRSGLAVVVYPVRAAVDVPFSAWDWLTVALSSRADLLEENAALRGELLEMSASRQRLAALEAENLRLRELLGSSRRVAHDVLVASLLRADFDPFRHRVTLNRGSDDGVREGMALLDAEGVVGQVTLTTPFSAEAVLISDPNHAIPVEINRNGVRTVALGTGDLNRLELRYLQNSADVEEGDLLVTSGLGGRFPRGYPVAVIASIRRDPGQAFAEITATPLAKLDRLREVLIVNAGDETGAPETRDEEETASDE